MLILTSGVRPSPTGERQTVPLEDSGRHARQGSGTRAAERLRRTRSQIVPRQYIELPKPKTIGRDHVANKDRSPTQEELQTLLDTGDLREKVVVALLAGGGFREETLTKLEYRHVKQDLEANKVQLHVHVDVEIVKGHYADYHTFLPQEAVDLLKLYLDVRRRGTIAQHRKGEPIKYIPPEEIRDNTPLIRQELLPEPVGPKNIYRIIHRLYDQANLITKNKNGHYDLRAHSLRKYFVTQLVAGGLQESHADFMAGHVSDEYNKIESLGPEKLREEYAKAGLTLRPRVYVNKLEMTKEVVKELLRKMDVNPEDLLRAFAAPHRTLGNVEAQDEQDLNLYIRALVDTVRQRASAPQNPPMS